ncbi:MAG: Xaa-Pro peptidase family protein [bacterium]
MDRRDFLNAALPAAGAAAVGMGTPSGAYGAAGAPPQEELPPAVASLGSMKEDEPPPISDEERWARIARAQRLMAAEGMDGIVMLGGTAMRYFADVSWGRSERIFAMVIPREGELAWICPAFERERALEQIRFGEDVRVWQEHESPYALIASILADRGLRTGRLGLEETTYYHVADGLQEDAPAVEVTSADGVTRRCRGVKSAAEIALMRHANQVTIRVYEAVFSSLREEMTQRDLGDLISSAYRRLGYSGGALCLFGENSAYPHGTENDQPLREGMVVLVDGGTRAGGYASDITRTAVYGDPTVEQRRVWTLVKEAQSAALRAAGPGVSAGEVDRAAREVITRGGYGPGYEYFTHRLGHGIGMDGHEWYYLVQGSEVPLEAGMTFSNEPGIYIYGSFGVRLEDIMVITAEGAELLTEQAASPTHPFGG